MVVGPPAIRTRGIVKRFDPPRRGLFRRLARKPQPPPVLALDKLDLEVPEGELFGLLGPNGAGKTTLVKILATLLLPTEGEAWVGGYDIWRDEAAIRRELGVVLGGERALYWRLTGRENLWYFAQLYDISSREAKRKAQELLELVGLAARGDDRVENYSKGMMQRLHIARGLLTDPRILLLDEPTIGLDPHAARSLRDLVRRLVDEQGKTVVLTTHYMYEADELSDRVGILHKGRIVALASPAELKSKFGSRTSLELRVHGLAAGFEQVLADLPGVAGVRGEPDVVDADARRFFVSLSEADDDAPRGIADLVAKSGGKLLAIEERGSTLEDVFVNLTGEGLQGAPPDVTEAPAGKTRTRRRRR
jgi:ABC-2 type transport system ATP-binding protein